MANIDQFIADFGPVIIYVMAFLLVLAIIRVICKFFSMVIQWYKYNHY